MKSIVDYILNNRNISVIILCCNYRELEFIHNEILDKIGQINRRFVKVRYKDFIEVYTRSTIMFVTLGNIYYHLRGVTINTLLISDTIYRRWHDNYDKVRENLDEAKIRAQMCRGKIGTYISQYDLDHWDEYTKYYRRT